MKLSLVVTTPGKGEGRVVPITLSQFLIGRDAQCHLRPASPMISNRHCALLVRGGKAYLRDFNSTNGTFLNEKPVKGEVEIHHEDQLRLGPLSFQVKVEVTTPVNKPTPVPPPSSGGADDESIAAMLLSLQDDGDALPSRPLDSDGIPQGSTVMDIPAPLAEGAGTDKADSKKKDPVKPNVGNTQSAAKAILEKYTRRQRNP